MDNNEISVNTTPAQSDIYDAPACESKSSRSLTFLKKHGWLLLAFFIPAALMFIAYAAMRVYPFGESSVLVLDLNGQYVYFFQALRDFVWGDNSLLYSFSRTLGGEFMGIYAYYLASPLSYIVALFPEELLLEALYLMLVIKVGLCSLSFALYLRISRSAHKITAVAFSLLYALSAYCIVYQHNTMWIDCVMWLPMLMLGIERLIDRKGIALYVISISCCLLFNFYIGYMCCLFTILYFFARFFATENISGEKNHFGRAFGRIALASIIGIMISAVIVLPAYTSLNFGKTEFSVPNFDFTSRFDFLELLSALFIGSYDTVRPEGLPLIYCGVAVILLAPLYFICKKIPIREKISYGILFAVLVFCMSCNTLDMVWHGFQLPNWLNYRYSFMLTALLLIFAAEVFKHIRQIGFRPVFAVGVFAVLLLAVMQKLDFDNLPDVSAVWLSILFIGIYLLVLFAASRRYLTKTAAIVMTVIFSLEAFSAALLNLTALDEDVVISSRDSYHNTINTYKPIVNEIKELDDSFYRMENVHFRYPCEPLSLGYRGIANSTSTINSETIKLLFDLGYASTSNWTKYIGYTPVNDSLMGIRYIIDSKDGHTADFYDAVTDNDTYNAYYNPYALSLAVAGNEAIKDVDLEAYDSPFDRLNAIVSALLGEEVTLFTPLEYTSYSTTNISYSTVAGHHAYDRTSTDSAGKVIFYYDIPQDGTYYVYLVSDYWREVNLSFGGYSLGTFFGLESWCISKPCYLEASEKNRLIMTVNTDNMYLKEDSSWVYRFNEELFEEVFEKLALGNYVIDEYSETHFKGTINAKEDGTVWTTIPYDEGWHITIDGEEIEPIKLCDALIGFDISAGEHTLQLHYMPDCFVIGATLSVLGILLFAAVLLLEKYRKEHPAPVSAHEAEEAPLANEALTQPEEPTEK